MFTVLTRISRARLYPQPRYPTPKSITPQRHYIGSRPAIPRRVPLRGAFVFLELLFSIRNRENDTFSRGVAIKRDGRLWRVLKNY